MELEGSDNFDTNTFTFQYGSILIKVDFDEIHAYQNIYIPIWFYFNELFLSSGRYTQDIYIPIWFYFNLSHQYK